MNVPEFEIITRYLKKDLSRRDVLLGIGDDAAVLKAPEGQDLVVTTDTLVSGVHFPRHTTPEDIAFKALAVNFSDLAAMGAQPAWVSLSLAMPKAQEAWLSAFSGALFSMAEHYGVEIIGGDTCSSPCLVITVTAQGFVTSGQAMQRSGAKEGDLIYVTGNLGDAGGGLVVATEKQDIAKDSDEHRLLMRLNRPEPRVAAGLTIRNLASAAIDISDGLTADLSHILLASQCGAIIDVDKIPLSPALCTVFGDEQALQYALSAGDDYELCFTVPEEHQGAVELALEGEGSPATCIGRITGKSQLKLIKNGEAYSRLSPGYQHFDHEG